MSDVTNITEIIPEGLLSIDWVAEAMAEGQLFNTLFNEIERLKAESKRKSDAIREFIYGEDHPEEYDGEVTRLMKEIERLKAELSDTHKHYQGQQGD